MRAIGSRLSSVVSALEDETHSSFDASALGFSDAIGGLSDFVSGWSHGRSEIASGVKDIQGSLVGASGAYEQVEEAADRVFGGGSK